MSTSQAHTRLLGMIMKCSANLNHLNYMHFQVAGTLARFFPGQTGLVLLGFDDSTLGPELVYVCTLVSQSECG
jgi:uncharacterized protein (DUF952 family)